MVRLPLAAALGSALAMRPRRAGTPPRKPAVVQTQVILAVMGALVLIVVGASLARAFGVVGIAGLIRYRAKVDDPKDASVMLAGLGVGPGLRRRACCIWLRSPPCFCSRCSGCWSRRKRTWRRRSR